MVIPIFWNNITEFPFQKEVRNSKNTSTARETAKIPAEEKFQNTILNNLDIVPYKLKSNMGASCEVESQQS